MTSPRHRARRATLDDLPSLKALWDSMRYPVTELEKKLTDFQVVESPEGQIIGALGVQLLPPHGCLHHEAYLDFALADELRPLLLARIQSLASNHGVLRLWTRERAPYWTRCGFQAASPDTLRKLPGTWADAGPDWLTLQLKDEAAIVALEKELALFMEAEKQRTARAFQRVHTLKSVSLWLAVIFGMLVLGAIVYLFLKNPSAFAPAK